MSQRIDFGSKYKTKYNDNPPPGQYDIDSGERLRRPKSPNVLIRERLIPERNTDRQDSGTDFYQSHTNFGANISARVNFGSKYKTKYNDNPPPGQYNVDAAESHVRSRSPAAKI